MSCLELLYLSIEGIPFIIRFKTQNVKNINLNIPIGIEGIPFIIRFKTILEKSILSKEEVLKVFHL